MPADKRADLGRLEKVLGAPRFSLARPDMLQEVLALTPGSVTPFGLINDTQRRVTVWSKRHCAADGSSPTRCRASLHSESEAPHRFTPSAGRSGLSGFKNLHTPVVAQSSAHSPVRG